MLKLSPEILLVVSHCELLTFLGYLGKTHVHLKLSEDVGICLLLILIFLSLFVCCCLHSNWAQKHQKCCVLLACLLGGEGLRIDGIERGTVCRSWCEM